MNETYCLPETPKVVHGLRGSTADIFLDNATYRKFLFNEFNVDEERLAILMVGKKERKILNYYPILLVKPPP